jgi:hypothetical protein
LKITAAAADKSIKNLSERLDDLYPDEESLGKGITHWKGKPIIPAKEWKKISGHYNFEFTTGGLKAFPDGLVEAALLIEGGQDPEKPLEAALITWLSEYKELLKFKKVELPAYDDTYIV